MDEDNALELEHGEKEFWSRFDRERDDLRVFAASQIDLFSAELLNQFLNRLDQGNWTRMIDPGFEIARKMMHRVVWSSVSTQIVCSIYELDKRVKRINDKARKKEKKKEASRVLPQLRSSSPEPATPPPLDPKIEAEKKKAEDKKRHAEWVKKQNENFEAEKIVRAAEKAIREARNAAIKATKKAVTESNNAKRVGLSSLGPH